MKDKLKISLICALIALIAGPLLFLILSGGAVLKTIIACLITAAVIAVIIFILTYVLDGKSVRLTIPVYIGAGIISLIVIASVLFINIAPAFLFNPHFDEDAYEELMDMEDTGRPAPEYLESSDGSISGWRIPAKSVPEDEQRPVILMFMGNGQESSSYALYIMEHEDLYSDLTVSSDLIFFDYPQYGQSTGDLNANGMRQMGLAAFDMVEAMPQTGELYVMGYSIGTGVACYVTSERDADGLILMAPYKNSYDLYNNVLDIFHGPAKLLVTFRMNSASYAAKVKCPVLIFASDEDFVVPYRSSQELFTCFTATSADFVTINGADHNDFLSTESVLDRAAAFVTGG